jgi:uncharacterized protein (UPF0548 family)
MFLVSPASKETIRSFINAQQDQPFSYPDVRATQVDSPPKNYTIDHNRIQLGTGRDAFARAKAAIRNWKMFDMPWTQLCWPDAPIEIDTTVAILVKHLGFWSLNAARIVYLLDEPGEIEKFGFAYGTLAEHGESGEERFSVEYHRDESVLYDLYAFSRPNYFLAKIGYPIARRLQKQFAAESKQAMVRAVSTR